MNTHRIMLLLSAFVFLLFIQLHAQGNPDFIGPLFPDGSASYPVDTGVDTSLSSILPQAATLKEEFQKLPGEIEGIKNIDQLNNDKNAIFSRLTELKNRLKEIIDIGNYGFEQIADLRSQTRILLELVNRLANAVSTRFTRSESLKQHWISREGTWSNHKRTYRSDSKTSIGEVIAEAETIIAQAKKSLAGIEQPLVSFQQQVIETQQACQNFIGEIDQLMIKMRKELFRRSRPAMFTPTFIRQFDKPLWEEFWLGIASLEIPDMGFFASYGWIIALQIIFSFALIYFFKNLKNYDLEQLKLGFIAQRYASASILLGVLLPSMLFEDAPKMIKLLNAGLIAVSAARLLAGRIETVWRRRLIYLLVTLFLIIQFFGLIALPAPLFRLFAASVSLFIALICFWRARVNILAAASMSFAIGVKTGGAAMMIVFLAQVAGYVALANHVLEVTIKTVFLGLIAWMIDMILRGVIEIAFDNRFSRQIQIINKYYRVFVKRASMLADIVVVFVALCGILSVWGIADNTSQAAEKIWNLGFSFKGSGVTLGLLVTAVFMIYLAIFGSWIVQKTLDEEVYTRKKVERGVGISINRLIHYAFIVLGVSLAFSTLGIGMQNLTVIIGAFGIGIGFGLQNIVNNFASGLILLFERSVKVGDVVQINGEWGMIKNLGLRATVVETFDHSEMIVPNSDLVSTMVTNWTLSDRQVRLIVKIGVAYGSDVNLITKLLKQVAQENPFVMKIPEPSVLFVNFGGSSLDFELRVWVADIDNRLKIKNEINREIDRLFRENKIEIPFSQHDLHLRTIDFRAADTIQKLAKISEDSEKK